MPVKSPKGYVIHFFIRAINLGLKPRLCSNHLL
jgi:hypothetical protein